LVLTKHMLTGLTYRGLSPHKFTPVPGVHKALNANGLCKHAMLGKFIAIKAAIVFNHYTERPWVSSTLKKEKKS
ncbi:hypothetical protein, partial [Desulfobacula sp.]|uniref:hypothetical protein n=1 Tax=Desulfobacula sp. TaxID=2593537 RepID=UPI002625A52E